MKTISVWLLVVAMSPSLLAEELSFNRDIRPILSENCFQCHGQDPQHREADLRLDVREEAIKDLGGYRAIVPGKPESSELVARLIAHDPDKKMPPPASNRLVTKEQIETIRRWIEEGASYQIHWAYLPPQKSKLPEVQNPSWPRQPFDRFVLSGLEKQGIDPSAESSPEVWLRRVSFDLIGLPPPPDEIRTFVNDVAQRQEAAYEHAVDRLLQSPHFGERMAMEWMDIARYADSHGFNNDGLRSMWRWRDWVIDAFNDNMPYDRFVLEQLAGDLLPAPTLEQQIATGFSRNHVINSEGGIIDEEYRVEYVADRVRTMSTAWLGLTTECARCHDHKFDPISQRDYYRLFAFFNNVAEHGEDGRTANAVPMIPAPTREQQRVLADQRDRLRLLDAEIADLQKSPELLIDSSDLFESKATSKETNDDWQWLLESGEARDRQVGNGISFNASQPLIQIAAKNLPFSKHKQTILSLWIKPNSDNPDEVAILSSIDYGGSPADTQYGKGRELRLVDGELEWRESSRLPVYSRIVITEGASVSREQWSQIVVIVGGDNNAAAVRFFVNGQEVATHSLYDGLINEAPDKDVLIGRDNAKDSSRFLGQIDELRWSHHLPTSEEIRDGFLKVAIPYTRSHVKCETSQSWLMTARSLSNEKLRTLIDQRSRLWEEHLALRRELPTTMVMRELGEAQDMHAPLSQYSDRYSNRYRKKYLSQGPRKTYVLTRGNYDAPGEEVDPGALETLLAPWPIDAPRNRLGLARWLTQPQHPLTSRVVVNRFWAQLFGVGLVKTVEDFGSQSEWPSHPELLDWLARDFVDSGWNVKALMKSLVLSAAYRQSSETTPAAVARDPENRRIGRGPRVRLPAELIRDQALAISGLLKPQIGGPSVYPYQPDKLYDGIVVGTEYPGSRWQLSQGDNLYRRSLYTFWKRTVTHPAMLTFDAPDREVCTARRSRTNTPLQALLLWNETGYLEASRQLGARMIKEGGDEDSSRVSFAFQLATGRLPVAAESEILVKAIKRLRSDFESRPADAAAFIQMGASPVDQSIAPADLAAAMAVANMILNLDETITKN